MKGQSSEGHDGVHLITTVVAPSDTICLSHCGFSTYGRVSIVSYIVVEITFTILISRL